MDNVIPLRPTLKPQEVELNFDECVETLKKGFEDKTLVSGKWFIFTVSPENTPMVSINGFAPGEIFFIMEAVKDWLMQRS